MQRYLCTQRRINTRNWHLRDWHPCCADQLGVKQCLTRRNVEFTHKKRREKWGTRFNALDGFRTYRTIETIYMRRLWSTWECFPLRSTCAPLVRRFMTKDSWAVVRQMRSRGRFSSTG